MASGVIERFRATLDAKWVRADKLHLTLVFLGNPTAAHVESFKPLVDAVASRHAAFSLELGGVGTFGTARAPSVLWLGVKGALESLRSLQAEAQRSLVTADLPGLKPDEHGRLSAPHVTLARSQHDTAFGDVTTALADFTSPPFRVGHVTLRRRAPTPSPGSATRRAARVHRPGCHPLFRRPAATPLMDM